MSIFRFLLARQRKSQTGRAADALQCRRYRSGFRPRLEILEDRLAPAVFTPTTFADSTDPASVSLRSAIFAAQRDPVTDTDTVQLAAGTYALAPQIGARGEINFLSSSHDIIIDGQGTTGPNATIIDASQLMDRVFLVLGGNVTFQNLVIQGGQAHDDVIPDGTACGGGLLVDGGTVSLRNVSFLGNTAIRAQDALDLISLPGPGRGGALSVHAGSVTGFDCLFDSNTAHGGLLGQGIIDRGIGGAGQGGAIYMDGGTIAFTDSTFTNNQAVGGFVNEFGSFTSETAYGGGIYLAGGSASFIRSTISENETSPNLLRASASEGGGLFVGPASISLTNCTIAGNSAGSGGGFYLDVGSTASLFNCTVAGNFATGGFDRENIGGGIVNAGALALALTNTLIADNSARLGSDFFGTVSSSDHNLVGLNDGYASGFNSSDLVGTYQTPINPLLGPLEFNGGPTQTLALLPGSPAIEAGDNTAAPATDQRGINRPQGSAVDIGAFEARAFTVVTVSGSTPQTALVNQPFAEPLGVVLLEGGSPLPGVTVTFQAPASGASATTMPGPSFPGFPPFPPLPLSGQTVVTDSTGVAIIAAAANALGGTYQVTAQVGAISLVFNLTNTPPIVLTGPPDQTGIGALPAPINLGSFVSVGGSGPWTVQVDFGDGTPLDAFSVTSPGALSRVHAFAALGNLPVTVTVSDPSGNSETTSFHVTVTSPIVLIAPPDQTSIGNLPLPINLGSFLSLGESGPWTVQVNYGDGLPLDTFTATSPGGLSRFHPFAALGNLPVTVTVSDPLGISQTTSFHVTVTSIVVLNTSDDPTLGSASLRAAVDAVNAASLTGVIPTISFSLPSNDPGYHPVTGTFTITLGSTLPINSNVVLFGLGNNLLSVSGNQACTVFDVAANVTSARLSGLVITGGSGSGGAGGGIDNSGTLEVDNSSFINNNASFGGAINNHFGTLTLDSTQFSGNSATQVGGAVNSQGSVVVRNHCSFANNSTLGLSSSGGAISCSGVLTVHDSTFTSNTATFGGAIEAFMTPLLSVVNCTFTKNVARDGGAIENFEGQATVMASTFANNTAQFLVAGSTNVAGGAIENTGGVLRALNSTFFGNQAIGSSTVPSFGGALENFAGPAPATLTLTNCTISGNSAQNGGGVDNSASIFSLPNPGILVIGNTIVAQDTANIHGMEIYGPVSSLGTNLIGASDDSSGWINVGANADLTGTRALPLNAFLAALASYGGPTPTMALQPRSPALDGGNNLVAVDAQGLPLTTDQRGFARIVDGKVDIGAFEVRSITTLTASPSPALVGQSVTLVATITQNGRAVTGGSVNFRDGANFLATGVPVNNQGQATLTVPGLSAGAHVLFAGYSPGALPNIDASGRFVLENVFQATTQTALTMPSDLVQGEAATFTATVSTTATGAGQPTGSVQFVVDGAPVGSPVPLTAGSAALTTSALMVGSHTIVAIYSGDASFLGSSASAAPIVYAPPTASAGGPYTMTFGGGLTLDATASFDPDGDPLAYSWTINGTTNAAGGVSPALTWSQLQGLGVNIAQPFLVSVTVDDGHGHVATASANVTVNRATPVLSWSNPGAINYGTPLSGAQLNATANVPGAFVYTPVAGTVLVVGTQTLSVSFTPTDTADYTSATLTVQLVVNLGPPSVYVLDATAAGALTVSGNAKINVAGVVQDDSSSGSALVVSGNANVNASAIDVHGGDVVSGKASFNHTPVTGASFLADPLSGLTAPDAASYGLTNQGAISLSGNASLTINPGIYSQINVSGNAKLVLKPGIYVIAGGGMTISGNATVSGTGVLIYNAGSNYNGSGNAFGALTVSGSATINLTAATTGPYAGIVYFQSRDNSSTISMSGNTLLNLHDGVLYAAKALVTDTGNGQIVATLVVDRLQLSGNATES